MLGRECVCVFEFGIFIVERQRIRSFVTVDRMFDASRMPQMKMPKRNSDLLICCSAERCDQLVDLSSLKFEMPMVHAGRNDSRFRWISIKMRFNSADARTIYVVDENIRPFLMNSNPIPDAKFLESRPTPSRVEKIIPSHGTRLLPRSAKTHKRISESIIGN